MNHRKTQFIPHIIGIVMSLWALNPMNPYGYYILLRIILCTICISLTFRSVKSDQAIWAWIFGITAAIYNPIIRVHLPREIWSVINVVTVIIFLLSVRTLRILDSK